MFQFFSNLQGMLSFLKFIFMAYKFLLNWNKQVVTFFAVKKNFLNHRITSEAFIVILKAIYNHFHIAFFFNMVKILFCNYLNCPNLFWKISLYYKIHHPFQRRKKKDWNLYRKDRFKCIVSVSLQNSNSDMWVLLFHDDKIFVYYYKILFHIYILFC